MAHFVCPGCKGKKAWKPQLAGKRGKCSCGYVLTVPAEPVGEPPEPVDFDEAIAAALEAEANAPIADPPPAAPQAADGAYVARVGDREAPIGVQAPGTVLRTRTAILPQRKGLSPEEKPPEPAASPLRDYVLPGILLLAGIVLSFVDGTYRGETGWAPLQAVMGFVVINMVASVVLSVGAVFLASAMGGVAFREPVPVIIYKLCAASLAPGAIASLAMHGIGGANGEIFSVFIGIGCYFLLFLLLFRMATADRFICVVLIFITRTAVAYMMFRLMGAKQGSEI